MSFHCYVGVAVLPQQTRLSERPRRQDHAEGENGLRNVTDHISTVNTGHLLFQKRGVDWKTGPEVSQQLSGSCVKMLQLALDIIGYHFCKENTMKGEREEILKG